VQVLLLETHNQDPNCFHCNRPVILEHGCLEVKLIVTQNFPTKEGKGVGNRIVDASKYMHKSCMNKLLWSAVFH
jgi:hypothetical protein